MLTRHELGPAIKAVQDAGGVAVPEIRWSTKLAQRIVQRRLLAEAEAYGSGAPLGANTNKALERSTVSDIPVFGISTSASSPAPNNNNSAASSVLSTKNRRCGHC